MATIADYLTELDNWRDQLASNLTAMGVTADSNEKLNTLVPKVLQIQSGTTSERVVLYNEENLNNLFMQYNDTITCVKDYANSHPAFITEDHALNYGTSVFGWDSQVWTCCVLPLAITANSQIAVCYQAGSTEAGIMRLVKSETSNPNDILTAAQTDGKYIDLPHFWLYNTDYITTLTSCENVENGIYYFMFVGRSNNSSPKIKSIILFS